MKTARDYYFDNISGTSAISASGDLTENATLTSDVGGSDNSTVNINETDSIGTPGTDAWTDVAENVVCGVLG